jgi:hypothetical protein
MAKFRSFADFWPRYLREQSRLGPEFERASVADTGVRNRP